MTGTFPSVDLSVIVVSWNVAGLLRRCLTSVLASPGFELTGAGDPAPVVAGGRRSVEVVVVDNASSDGSAEIVGREFPGVVLLANRENRGFTAGNNQAIAAARGRTLLLLNPDAELVGDAAKVMLEHLDANPGVAVVGPRLLNPDGTLQSSRRRFPTLATALVESTMLQGLFAGSGILRRYYVDDVPADRLQDVDWVVGAAMMVRRVVVDQLGGLDERFFMYSEELDWCRRIKSAPSPVGTPWRVVYLPDAAVVHHEGKSSEQLVAARHIHFHTSKIRYFAKHHGSAAAAVLRAFLLATFSWQLLEESAKWLVGHKRPLRAQRVGEIVKVLRSGLDPRRPPQ